MPIMGLWETFSRFNVPSYSSVLLASAMILSCAVLTGAIYRLYFSPIASFPGPKLAALTLWYEFYYDVICGGQYVWQIRALHERYGPIVRINPYELHVSEPSFYEVLYATSASGKKRNKWAWYTKQFDSPGATFSTVKHEDHKLRRAPLNKYFGRTGVQRLQPIVDERFQCLMGRIRELRDEGVEAIDIDLAFSAYTNDIIQQYAYGRSDHRLESPNFAPFYHDASKTAGKLGALLKQMIWIYTVVKNLPEQMMRHVAPELVLTSQLQQVVEKQILQVKSEPKVDGAAHPTIFHEILDSNLPESDKTVRRLRDEAWIVVGAGTLTTAWTLTVATYHLLQNPDILRRLKNDLRTAIPDPDKSPRLSILENIPYLTAIIKEALRLSYGVCSRLPRISPVEAMLFKDPTTGKEWTIPANTVVSMTSTLLHHDESIYPDSKRFLPERWMEDPSLEKYLFSFSKGSRQCLGINLAYGEIYVALAGVFRRWGSAVCRDVEDEGVLELWETEIGDVEIARDGFVPLTRDGSKGVRIKARK